MGQSYDKGGFMVAGSKQQEGIAILILMLQSRIFEKKQYSPVIILFQHTFTYKENDIKEDIYRLSVTDEVVRVLAPRKESQKYCDNIG